MVRWQDHRSALEVARSLRDRDGLCFLDSALGSGPSRVFWSPRATFRFRDGRGTFVARDGSETTDSGDPFAAIAGWLRRHPEQVAAGYWSYDLRYALERLPAIAHDDLPLPWCRVGFYDRRYEYDPTDNEGAWILPTGDTPPLGKPGRAGRRLEPPPEPRASPLGTLHRSFSREEYEGAVRRVLDYIAAGDCYQVNLSQRFSAPLALPAWELYERLRRISPAPYAAYLDAGNHQVLSSSPELFLSVCDGHVETRPIKGTRPRGRDPEEDRATAAELLSSEKDRAELLMIVDLERNDLGRVCEYGTVHVPDLFRLESYSNVHHLVATVCGRLRPGLGPLDALRAAFPGGSITGAPKIRAMEIIEELEPVRRGVYTGALGWVNGTGSGEWNIAIRTMVTHEGQVHFHAGGGIVADSHPAAEYEETLVKARGMLRALSGRESSTV